MPGTSGLELQALLIAGGYALPIIIVRVYPDARLRDRALAAGALCVLSKPFAAEELLRFIESALALDASSPTAKSNLGMCSQDQRIPGPNGSIITPSTEHQ